MSNSAIMDMNRKTGSNDNGAGEESHNSKRRRWAANANGDASASASRGGQRRDLEEITRHRYESYGYPSSDSDSDANDTRSASRYDDKKKKPKKVKQRRARNEQRLGMRTFRNTNDENSDNDGLAAATAIRRAMTNNTSATLPTPRGWTSSTTATSTATATPRNCMAQKPSSSRPSTDLSKGSGFTLSSGPNTNNNKSSSNQETNNPYTKKSSLAKTSTSKSLLRSSSSTPPPHPQTSRTTSRSIQPPRTTSHHITIAISENLARETCVASIDAARPTYLHITKQSNGQTYSETFALLRVIHPHEILLNEGRKNSYLAKKILEIYCPDEEEVRMMGAGGMSGGANLFGKKRNAAKRGRHTARGDKTSRFGNRAGVDGDATQQPRGDNDACETTTVVKFVPRSYFDQTKGAELLRKLARTNTYNASIVEEYILLSASHAVLQYAQLCLGAGLTRGCLTLDVNTGGNHRMSIDRSTMVNLELLVNSKTGRTANSLVGTIDCTKTSVGGRLLRTNLMAPPTRLDTIHARLDLVDSLLEDEEFFYAVMEHLEDLPDVDKMLSYIALAPRKKQRWDNTGGGNGSLFGNTESPTVTTRMASKGISALVCIKSTLSVIPSFAHVLEVQLKELDEREHQSSGGTRNQNESRHQTERSVRSNEDESTTVVESETSRLEGDLNTVDLSNQGGETDQITATSPNSSLQIGMGTSSVNYTSESALPLNTTERRFRHQLLRAILIAMTQPALSRVLEAVTGIFTESTTYSKNSHAMRHQECFALKPNTDGMMDVLRKAFLANVDDIYRLADEYAETYDIHVQVKETTSRGYYLSVSADLGLDLPQIFIQPVKNGRFIYCTTEEVYSLNSRAQENVQDLLLMTHERIQDVLRLARENYDCIASLADAIALLDLCHCFADNVASSRLPCCRPVLSDHGQPSNNLGDASVGGGGAIAIRNGRYAVDVSSTGVSATGGDFIPNDTYSSALQNFTVITGINGSGKSTYLKQIALIVILAHCGSYVPADEAFIPVRDQICTRIGTSDDQEHNISTFLLEMKETAFICNSTTDRSLFLLDELGRATSNEDGIALAWAVSEYLLTKRAMTFFVTHYPQLSKLADVYPNVQNQHLGSQIQSNGDTSSINYTHKIMPGPCTSTGDYGVDMAVTCGWPDDVVRNARRIQKEVKRMMPGEDLCYNEFSNENFAENRRNAHNILCDIAKHLGAMKEGEGRLTKEAKKHYLQDLRLRLVPTNDDSMVRMIRNLLLNVDDCAPSIPLSRPKQVIEVAHTAVRETAASNEETSAIDEVMAEVSTANNTEAAATMQLECVFSSSSCDSSNGSSYSSRMSTELLKSRGDEDEADSKPFAKRSRSDEDEPDTKPFAKRSFECIPSAIEQSHPMIPRHGPLNKVVRKEDQLEK